MWSVSAKYTMTLNTGWSTQNSPRLSAALVKVVMTRWEGVLMNSSSHAPGLSTICPPALTWSSSGMVEGQSRGYLAPLTLPVTQVSPDQLSPIPGNTMHCSKCYVGWDSVCWHLVLSDDALTWILLSNCLLSRLRISHEPDLPGLSWSTPTVVSAGRVNCALENRFRKGISCKTDHLTEHENISKLQSWRQYLTGPPKISPESHELHMTRCGGLVSVPGPVPDVFHVVTVWPLGHHHAIGLRPRGF